MTIDHDDALLDALGRGEPAPDGDDLAALLSAWHSEVADIDPIGLRSPVPVTEAKPVRVKRRFPRPLAVALAAAALAFGGLTAASATAGPGNPLWPITQLIFPQQAGSKVAVQEAQRLLEQARAAIAEGRHQDAAQLVADARTQIALITDPDLRQKLEAEAAAILAQAGTQPAVNSPGAGLPTPLPSGVAPQPTTSPSPGQGGVLPPILPPILPSLLPSGLLPSLPLLGG